MTVEELDQRMDYTEYDQWIALYEVEGEERQREIRKAQGK